MRLGPRRKVLVQICRGRVAHQMLVVVPVARAEMTPVAIVDYRHRGHGRGTRARIRKKSASTPFPPPSIRLLRGLRLGSARSRRAQSDAGSAQLTARIQLLKREQNHQWTRVAAPPGTSRRGRATNTANDTLSRSTPPSLAKITRRKRTPAQPPITRTTATNHVKFAHHARGIWPYHFEVAVTGAPSRQTGNHHVWGAPP